MNTKILIILASTIILTAAGFYNIPTNKTANDAIPFSYCNPGGKPTIYSLTTVTSFGAVTRSKNTFVLMGNILQSVYLKQLKMVGKISVFVREYVEELEYTTVVGLLDNKIDLDFSNLPTVGDLFLTL